LGNKHAPTYNLRTGLRTDHKDVPAGSRAIIKTVTRYNVKKIIIEGMTHAGRKFRPSDWAERMSGSLSTFGRDQRIRYSPLLQPLTIDGVKCVALDPEMQVQFPEMYRYIMGWANNNDLIVKESECDIHGAEAHCRDSQGAVQN
jgi:hypothetical protein